MNADILLVDDDPVAIRSLGKILEGLGNMRFATNGGEALRLARSAAPHLVLLDAQMPGMSGLHVVETMRADRKLADLPVIFVTSHVDPHLEATAFALGITDYLTKPVRPETARARVQSHLHRKRSADALADVARLDMLTQVASRGEMEVYLEREWRRGLRNGDPISVLAVDVDHFNAFNEVRGRSAGDDCLRAIARVLESTVRRPGDLVARYASDRFVIALPQTPRDGAQHVAHRVLDAIERLQIDHPVSTTSSHVTASAGVSYYDADSPAWIGAPVDARADRTLLTRVSTHQLLAAAAHAVQAAKNAGRAQAWVLDVADADRAARARELLPIAR